MTLETIFKKDDEGRLEVNVGDLPVGSIPVRGIDGFNTSTNKINFVVPNGKVVGITSWTLSTTEGKFQVEWQIDGVIFDGSGLNEQGGVFSTHSAPAVTPIAIATVMAFFNEAGVMMSLGLIFFSVIVCRQSINSPGNFSDLLGSSDAGDTM